MTRYRWLALLTSLALLVMPSLALALTYQGSGFGDANINECWTDYGTPYNGQPQYVNADADRYLFWDGANTWYINDAPSAGGSSYYFSYLLGTTPNGTYAVGPFMGSSPGGTISLVSCGGGPPATSTLSGYGLWSDIATSTAAMVVDNGVPFWEIALGILMALMLLFLFFGSTSKALRRLLK